MSFGITTYSDEIEVAEARALTAEDELGVYVAFVGLGSTDRFGELVSEAAPVTVKVSSVATDFRAYEAKERVGWKQPVDLVLYVTKQAMDSAGITFLELQNDYRSVIINGYRYSLYNPSLVAQINLGAIYYMIGGVR